MRKDNILLYFYPTFPMLGIVFVFYKLVNTSMTQKSPFFSIVMPAYNSEKYISFSINSVILQTFIHWELIIVNDHSNDNTKNIVEEFSKKDDRIFLVESPHEMRKAGLARQFGTLKSRGKYICFLDSDDLYEPKKLETHYNLYQEKPEIEISSTAWHIIDHDDHIIKTKNLSRLHKFYFSFLSIQTICLLTNPICTSTSVIKKELLDKYDYSLYTTKISEDFLLWGDLIHTHDPHYHFVDIPLSRYRIHPSSLTHEPKMNINYYGVVIFSILLSANKINFFQWMLGISIRLFRNLITRKSIRL